MRCGERPRVSALVYGEQTPDYWFKYFHVVQEKDAQGLDVELGGSSVNNLADNLQLFGMAPGAANLFAATYTVFGDVVKSQYPKLVPSYYPVEQVVDTSFIKELAAAPTASAAEPDLPKFTAAAVKDVLSRKAWDIKFETGSAKFKPEAVAQLKALFNDLVVAGGANVEVHGHTDDVGSQESNNRLSEERAFAVKKWLQEASKVNFPDERVRVFSHGAAQPLEPNSTPDGRAKNRRVEIVIGTTGS